MYMILEGNADLVRMTGLHETRNGYIDNVCGRNNEITTPEPPNNPA
jgi:hypothetical protein